MVFEQATIKIEREQEFAGLKAAIIGAFSSGSVQKFLKGVASAGIRVRDFDSVLAKRLLEQNGSIEKDRSAKALYDSLTLTDQAQMKEFYLSKIEEVGPELRAKFQKIYQYY